MSEGQLFENTVINQLSKYGPLSFYNKRNTAEIDTILDKKTAFEIKLTGTVQDHTKVSSLTQALGITESFVISKKFLERDGFLSPVIF